MQCATGRVSVVPTPIQSNDAQALIAVGVWIQSTRSLYAKPVRFSDPCLYFPYAEIFSSVEDPHSEVRRHRQSQCSASVCPDYLFVLALLTHL